MVYGGNSAQTSFPVTTLSEMPQRWSKVTMFDFKIAKIMFPKKGRISTIKRYGPNLVMARAMVIAKAMAMLAGMSMALAHGHGHRHGHGRVHVCEMIRPRQTLVFCEQKISFRHVRSGFLQVEGVKAEPWGARREPNKGHL